MLKVLHELVDAVAGLKAIDHNQQADLHAQLDQTADDIAGTGGPAGRALASTMLEPAKTDEPS